MIKRIFGFLALGAMLSLISCAGEYESARAGASNSDSLEDITDSSARSTGDSIIYRVAETNEVLVQQMESFPVQVRVLVKGNLPDACTTLDSARVRQEDSVFMVMLQTRRAKDAVCAQVVTPYEKIIPLDVTGLGSGTFTVNVNGTMRTFKLLTKNELDKRE